MPGREECGLEQQGNGKRLQRAAEKSNAVKASSSLHMPAAALALDDQPVENALSVEDLYRRLLRLKSNKAMDAYGWSHESMQALWAAKLLRRDPLRDWIHQLYGMYAAHQDKTHCLLSKIVLLRKSETGSLSMATAASRQGPAHSLAGGHWLQKWHCYYASDLTRAMSI